MSTLFGRRIKEQRRHLGLSLRRVCEVVFNEDGKPISVSYLNDIEQGARNPPSGKIVVHLAQVLQLNEQELLELAGKSDPVIVEAIIKDRRVAALFRKMVQDPKMMDRARKAAEGNS